MDLLSELQQIGLTKREAEVYMALLKRKEFTAPELAKITTVTRTKIYEILQALVHKGICNENYKNGNKVFRAVKPKIALQNIIANYEQTVEQKKKTFEIQQKVEIEQKKKAAKSLEKAMIALHKTNQDCDDPLDYIEVLTDKGQIRERWLGIQKDAKKEILVFTKPPYTIPTIRDNVVEEDSLINEKQIRVRSIYEYKGLNSQETNDLIETIELYEKVGEKAKIIKELPMKLMMSDETVTMFALNDRVSLKPSITTMIVDHPSFAKALKTVFESYWTKAIPIKEFKKNMNKYIKEERRVN